jgi:protein SCO1
MRNHTFPGREHGRVFLILIVMVAAMAAGLIVANNMMQRTAEWRAAQLFPTPRPGGRFRTDTATGEHFSRANLEGQWNLLFFGFTNCPDVCPDTLAMLAQSMRQLELMRRDVKPQVVFVSVDPERDQGELLADYVQWFDSDFVAVTGDERQLLALTRQLGIVYYLEEPDERNRLLQRRSFRIRADRRPRGTPVRALCSPPGSRASHGRPVSVDRSVNAPAHGTIDENGIGCIALADLAAIPAAAKTADCMAWRLSNCRTAGSRTWFITIFVQMFRSTWTEAERSEQPEITLLQRLLHPGPQTRCTPAGRNQASVLISPCDGTISQLGNIAGDSLIQAKGIDYTSSTPCWARRTGPSPFEERPVHHHLPRPQ